LPGAEVDLSEQDKALGGFGPDEPGRDPSGLSVAVVTALRGARTLIVKGAIYFVTEELVMGPFDLSDSRKGDLLLFRA